MVHLTSSARLLIDNLLRNWLPNCVSSDARWAGVGQTLGVGHVSWNDGTESVSRCTVKAGTVGGEK